LPVLLFSGCDTKLLLRGGTNVQASPAVEYIEYILLPFLKTYFDVNCHLEVRTKGFSSKGGGEVFMRIEGLKKRLRCIEILNRGEVIEFTGVIWTARQKYHNVPPLYLYSKYLENGFPSLSTVS
jgi:RNA 3'-terminal phosphate cyclase (ATP)